ncbi:MAG: PQQ-binding-like beta-propeller repeat protein [Planctomycetota bacterium]
MVASDETVSSDPGATPLSEASPTGQSDEPVAVVPAYRIALVIIALMWALATIPGLIFPMTMIHFMTMQFSPALAAVALSIWWFASLRVPLKHRVIGWLVTVSMLIATIMAADTSMSIPLFVRGLPVALSVLIIGMWLTKSVRWPRPGLVSLSILACGLLAAQFVRADRMNAEFGFNLVPRWQPTAEELFLAASENEAEPSIDVQAIRFPDESSYQNWTDFRGPNRDGVISGVGLSTDWKSAAPQELWRRPVGPGWSSFCVVGPLAFTQEQRGDQEAVVAYSVEDGSVVWVHEYPGRFEASMGGIGPRATPTYRDERLYVTGGSGRVFCLNAVDGDFVWEYDLMAELEVRLPDWGFSSSPLVLEDKLIVFAGGDAGKGTVALAREDGQFIWSAGDGTHGYSSPQRSTLHGQPQVLVASDRGIRSFRSQDGELLWQHDWEIGPMPRVTQPIVVDDTVYLTTGYGNGTQRIDVAYDDGVWSTTEQWTAPLKPYFNDAVYHDGFIYGFDGPIFMCLDADDGTKAWKRGRYGHGQVLLLADQELLLVITEEGELVLLEANPKKHVEIAEMESIEGVTWNHPVIAGGRLFVRNSEEMVCYSISSASTELEADSSSGVVEQD